MSARDSASTFHSLSVEKMAAYNPIGEGNQKEEFSDFVEQLLYRKFYLVQLYTGSCFELPAIYFFENVTDIDNIRYRRDICAINKGATTPKDFKGTVLTIQSKGSHHGYVRLYCQNNNMPYIYAMPPEQRPALSQVLFQKSEISKGLISDDSWMSKWLANFRTLSRDLVDAIWCPNWPEEANEWKLRERRNGWPLENTVNRIANNGCFLVAKPHLGSRFIANEWRFSFSEAELILIHTWSDEQMFIYHILRLIKSDVVRKCGGKMMTVLTTYHFKTLMFWACEEKPKEFWLHGNIESAVKELILVMIEWLTEKQCRNYFIPVYNMLDHLPDSHNFEREVQFLTDSLTLVDQFALNTVSLARKGYADRCTEIPVRIPTNVLFAIQLRARRGYIVDPSRQGRQMYKQGRDIGKSHLFRSDIFNLFQCLTIQRRLTLTKDLKEKLNGLHEVEKCFKKANEKQSDGFVHLYISPMDNFHTIIAKFLSKTIDSCTNSIESLKSNHEQAESIPLHKNSTRRELCYSRTESTQRSHAVCILEMFLNVMNEKIAKPTCFHTAAYEANFYWTIFGDEVNDRAKEIYKKALAICNKWLSFAETIEKGLMFIVCIGKRGLPIIISNRWSGIFDKYIQILLGFLSLVKAITSCRSRSNYKMTDTNKDFSVLVHVHAIDFLAYIRYQCKFHLKYYFTLDDSFTDDMANDISKLFLYTAARISTETRRTFNFQDL